ncbi:MAG: type IV pilin protein [Candidatus Binatia bacterium]
MHNKKGFTLIELLIVVAIIGILSAIAIPRFAEYRAQSVCAGPVADAKNAFIALESYFARNLSYGTLADTDFRGTEGVSVQIVNTTPLVVAAIDNSGRCPNGTTYTLSEASGQGSWSP